MLDYQAIIKSDTATRLLNVFTFEYSIEEQQKIVNILYAIDEIIAQSESEVSNLERQKKAAMQKIFSQEVRFKRDDGTAYPDWKEKKIGEVFIRFATGLNPRDNFILNDSKASNYYVTIKNFEHGILHLDDNCDFITDEAIQMINKRSNLQKDDIIVSTTGKTSREIFEIREANGEGHSNDFLTVGSMGHTASIAYGVSIGTDKNVWCIDGDGSFIMHMGGMAVIGSKLPKNFKYILNDNHAHESVGGQPTCSASLDIPAILKACGFKDVLVAETEEEIKAGVNKLKDESGVAMVLRTRQGSREDLGRPTTTPIENKIALMKKLGE